MEILNGYDMANNLGLLGSPCKFTGHLITPSAVVYNFKSTNLNYTENKRKSAVYRLGEFSETQFDYLKTEKGFSIISALADKDRYFPDILAFNSLAENSFALGIDNTNKQYTANLDYITHLLVCGQTGSGKSVFINSLIYSLSCFTKAENCGLMLIDVKRVEFAKWKTNSHLVCPILDTPTGAINGLNSAVAEMERRYEILKKLGLDQNNGTFPKLVIIIDELADLMLASKKEIETPIIRLAQMGRACGIHLILCTQRPTVNVVTGLIKANIPSRIAFAMASYRDSITLLDHKGAETLKGKGDCIVKIQGNKELHLQAPFISNEIINQCLN